MTDIIIPETTFSDIPRYDLTLGASNPTNEFQNRRKVAATNILVRKVVALNSSDILYYPSNTNMLSCQTVLGVVDEIDTNHAYVKTNGATISYFGWTWTTNHPVFLGINGEMTQTVPLSGTVLIIGIALSPTKIFININDPINQV